MRLHPPAASVALLAALSACAAREPSAVDAELRSLRAEIRALRADRESDRRRLELLEAHATARSRAAPASRDVLDAPQGALPGAPADLAVVRLERGAGGGDGGAEGGSIFIVDRGGGRGGPEGGVDSAPPLDTDVELREPGELAGLAPAPAPAPAPAVDYEAGVAALAEGKVAEAAALLERFVGANARHAAADNALVSLGEAYARSGQPGRALKVWQRVVSDYPAGDSVARALLRYASTCSELGRKAAARAALERVIQDYPGTEAASEARTGLSGLGG